METKRISALPNVVNAATPTRDEPAASSAASPVLDLAFLAAQTLGDEPLQREVLSLFLAQVRRLVPGLADRPPRDQRDTAHLLKGSARGIGAWAAADAADDFERAEDGARPAAYATLVAAFAAAETAIATHLGV